MVMDMYPPGSSAGLGLAATLKVDKVKMIDISFTDDNESESVSASMEDLRFDVSESYREKKDPKDVKWHRELFLFGIRHLDM
ncbi:hypothetical protein C5167_035165, partial [Papaver somniferum]